MHLVAPEVGLMGTSVIIAAAIPLALGAAMAFAMQRTERVAVAFFGDGATEGGVFHESLNIAALRKIPIIFICEHNLYSCHLHIQDRRPKDNILEIALANSIPAFRIDGNNVIDVYQTAQEAVDNARSGRGPTFIECRTYRWLGHVGPSTDLDKGLRSQEELDEWIARCPIRSFEMRLINSKLITETEIQEFRKNVARENDEAINFGRSSPWPDPADLAKYVFSGTKKALPC